MGKQFGIDVSEWNGNIEWKTVKPHINFAMLRAGYGSKTVDAKFKQNAMACMNNNIPFGAYWFSYATSEDMAKAEAKKCIATVKPFSPSLPIAFDFEYDSMEYAKKKGIAITPNKMCAIARAFLNEIKSAGYGVLLYTNPDFWYYKGFKNLGDEFPVWCAHWGADKPGVYCSMWQDSNLGRVEGIDGNVDTNVSYIDYKAVQNSEILKQKLDAVMKEYAGKYYDTAVKVISGEYGNGNARTAKLISEKKDPEFVQAIVNIILSR